MAPFPLVFIVLCVSIFLSDNMTYCKNVVDIVVKNETDFQTTTVVSDAQTAAGRRQDRTLNAAPDRNMELNSGATMIPKNVAKRLTNASPTVTTTTSILTKSSNNSSSTTSKPKSRKSRTGIVTTRSPQKRPSQNVIRPTKSAVRKKIGGTSEVRNPNTTTAGPKPNKRLSGIARKSLYAGDDANRKPNRTADGDESTTVQVTTTDFKSKYPTPVWRDHGFYTDDYVKLINGHWFKFMPPNPASHYVLGFLYVIIMVFGCSGNFLVIFMYIKCKSLQTPANVLIMNLAVSDFFMLAKTPVFIYNSYFQGPALGKLGCQIYGFFGGLTGTVSIMTLAAISLDRYYVIVHPLNAAVKTTKRRARAWIGLIWVYGFMFSIVPVLDLGYNRYVPEGYLTSCSFDYLTDDLQEKGFILVFFAAAWCVPFTAISYCYTKILLAVWTTSEMAAASRFGQEEEKRKTEIRLGYVVVGVIMLWFVSWTPYAVVALLGVFDQKEYITPLGSMVPALFCKAASSMDPWIYAITHPRFKVELTKLLSKKKSRKLQRDYGVKKGWDHQSRSICRDGGVNVRNYSSTEDEDVEEVFVMANHGDDNDKKKIYRQGSTSSYKTEETKALETKFPPTRQESLKYMPPSWYKLPRTSSKNSIKLDSNLTAVSKADGNKNG